MNKINACIIGARSLSSGELLKLLANHKYVNMSMLISGPEVKGKYIQEEFPFLRGIIDKQMETYDCEKIINNCDVIFMHKKHGEGIEKTDELIEQSQKIGKNNKIIDLSADFRLKDMTLYKKWYNFEHKSPKLLEKAVYGLTELNREKIKGATLVANPGCYPTASLLALAPLLKNNLVDSSAAIIIDAYSGVSGAGKSKNNLGTNLAINVEANIIPYKIGHEHQHIPEMEQEISSMLNKEVSVTFSPHVLSFKYGILSTSYVKLKERYKGEEIYSIYKKIYKNEPFIRLSNKDEYPQVKNVVGTNFCDIAFKIDRKSKIVIVMSAIDNVIKGASGQAIQNMNVMYGYDEIEGLPYAEVLRKKAARLVSPSLQSRAKNSRKIRALPSVVDGMNIAG